MNILYDHQIFSWQRYGGISRYYFELSKHLVQDAGVNVQLGLRYSNNEYLQEENFFKAKQLLPQKKNVFIDKTIELVNQQKSIALLKKQQFDIFHPTYYNPYFLKNLGKKPFVLTILDMIHELYQDMFPQKTLLSIEQKKIVAQQATKIIAISENTKEDIMRLLGISEKKIEVVYLGNSLEFNPDYEEKDLNLPAKYVLFVGDRHMYKNYTCFIKALAPLLNQDPELMLICAGGKPFTESELALHQQLNISSKIRRIAINNNQRLAYIYHHALAFVFSSLYEGFGIPVLESFACQCPAIISESSSLKEIGGNAVAFFNPQSEESIRLAIQNVIYDEQARQKYIRLGQQRLAHFSWAKTAEETLNVYQSLL